MAKGTDLLVFFVMVLILVMSYSYLADQINTLAIAEGANEFIIILNMVFPYLYFTILLSGMIAIFWKVFQ